MQGTPTHDSSLKDIADLGTPSAPPMVEIGEEGDRHEVETKEGICSSGEGSKKELADWTTQTGISSESNNRY